MPNHPTQRTKNCPYCIGRGRVPLHTPGFGSLGRFKECRDCHGNGQVCILCIRPLSECECSDSRFDDGNSPCPENMPVTKPF
jgi:DnaJ-class molecular chaperone